MKCHLCSLNHEASALCSVCGVPFCRDCGAISVDGLPVCQDCPHDRVDFRARTGSPAFHVTSGALLIYEGDSEYLARIALAMAELRGYQARLSMNRA